MYHGAITVPLRPPTNRLRWLPPLVFFLAVPFLRANLESLFVPRVPFNPSGGRSASGIGLVFASGFFSYPRSRRVGSAKRRFGEALDEFFGWRSVQVV